MPGIVKVWIGAAVGAVLLVVAVIVVLLMVLISAIAGPSTQSANAAGPCLPAGVGTNPGSAAQTSVEVRAEQIENAQKIDAATQKAGLSGQASRIAIITAMGESTLMNLDYGDQVNGVTNPDGSAATSYGLFQQQTSQGWGTKEQVMDPEYATTSFLLGPNHDRKGGLVTVKGWENNSDVSQVIHAVQRNSDSGHYNRSISAADGVIEEAEINVDRAGEAPPESDTEDTAPGDTDTGTVLAASSCGGASGSVDPQNANDDYPWLDITPGPGVYVADPLGYYYGECTSFAAFRLNRDAGTTEAPFKYTQANGYRFGNGKEWKAAWIAQGWQVSNTPVAGAIAYWDSYGGGSASSPQFGIGEAGHVAYVQAVTDDGKAVIEEYNNAGEAPPGHKYSMRPQPVEPSEVNAFLYPPPKD